MREDASLAPQATVYGKYTAGITQSYPEGMLALRNAT